MAVALQHQLTAAGIAGGLLKPASGVGGAMSGLQSAQSGGSALQLAGEGDAGTSTLTLLEPPGALLHPALRNVKAINIGESNPTARLLLQFSSVSTCLQVADWDASDRYWEYPDPA